MCHAAGFLQRGRGHRAPEELDTALVYREQRGAARALGLAQPFAQRVDAAVAQRGRGQVGGKPQRRTGGELAFGPRALHRDGEHGEHRGRGEREPEDDEEFPEEAAQALNP